MLVVAGVLMPAVAILLLLLEERPLGVSTLAAAAGRRFRELRELRTGGHGLNDHRGLMPTCLW
jgi:hypothetical protein